MIGYFLKAGFRSIVRHRRYSLIGILSLSVGITILFLVEIFTGNELKVDRFHRQAKWIYKVSYGNSSFTPGPLSNELADHFPEIKNATHIETHQLFAFSPVLIFDNRTFEVEGYYSADSSFFRVFDFEGLYGDINSALSSPFSIILTESEAMRIFNTRDPIGETLTWKIYRDLTFTVAAIVRDPPPNSSIRIKGLISEPSLGKMGRHYHDDWGYASFETYLLLYPGTDAIKLEQELRNHLIDYYATNLSTRACYADASTNPPELHALREVYFNKDLTNDTTNRGDLLQINILIAIGIIIMTLSIINYINLFVARAMTRARETGIQKICGSGRRLLIAQYLTETIVVSFIAAIVGLIATLLILPRFSQFMNTGQSLKPSLPFLLMIIPGILVTGIIAGIYPAFWMSSRNVVSILKNQFRKGRGGIILRYTLIIFQFSASMIMIASTLIINRQLNYIRNKDLGIATEKVVYAKLPFPIRRGNREVFRNRVLAMPDVEEVSFSSTVFGEIENINSLETEGRTVTFSTIWTDDRFVGLYDLKLSQGREFSRQFRRDVNATALINESAVKAFNVEDPCQIRIRVPGGQAQVIGVVEDFNFKSLHKRIEPIAVIYLPAQAGYVNIRMSGSDIHRTLNRIGEIWADLAPGYPFDYQFLEKKLESQYKNDARMRQAIMYFSLIAIIIAILGIIGISAYLLEKRVKEAGIHKVYGAKPGNLLLLFNRNFLTVLAVSFGIACPITRHVMNNWLERFAYRTGTGVWVYLLSGLLVAVFTLTVVSWQSWYYAKRNPVDALRYE